MIYKNRFEIILTYSYLVYILILLSILSPGVCIVSDYYCDKVLDIIWEIIIGCISISYITIVFNKLVPGFRQGWRNDHL